MDRWNDHIHQDLLPKSGSFHLYGGGPAEDELFASWSKEGWGFSRSRQHRIGASGAPEFTAAARPCGADGLGGLVGGLWVMAPGALVTRTYQVL